MIIPSYCDERSPPGERILFNVFEQNEKDWVVLHSLDLAPYNRNLRTEIDFLVVIPSKGIICIEVKSQENVYFDHDGWHPGTLAHRDPFVQARDASCAFRRRIVDKFGNKYRHVPILPIVVFPRSKLDIGSVISINHSEFVDSAPFQSRDSASKVISDLQRNFVISIDQDPKIKQLTKPLGRDEIEEIIHFCRPIRKRLPDLNEEVQERRLRMDKLLRQQQYPVINLVDYNSRLLISGGAGTGKTLIGLEVARRKAESGFRVAYICYNRLLAQWVGRQVKKNQTPNLITGTVNSLLNEMTDTHPPQRASESWWEFEGLNQIMEKLTSPNLGGLAKFDYLVVDELQDILSKPLLWDCLKELFGDTLANSHYLLMGDFEHQTLSVDMEIVLENLSKIECYSCHWKLQENCRNYKELGDLTVRISGFDTPPWVGYMRSGGGFDVASTKLYENVTDQIDLLETEISSLEMQGYKLTDITVLSYQSYKSNVFESLKIRGIPIHDAERPEASSVNYSTVKKFKGMESPVILLADVYFSPNEIEYQRRLFYTALTRSTERVVIFCKESAKYTLSDWMNPTD